MKKISLLIVIGSLFSGCDRFLEAVPDQKLAIPATLNDLDLMLNNIDELNGYLPYSPEVMADNYYVSTSSWASIPESKIRNQYCWQKDESINWSNLYIPILISNTILESLAHITYNPDKDSATAQRIKGSALFFKGFYYAACAQVYAAPYDEDTAPEDLGIVLRRTSDFNERSFRASNQQTYNEIIQCFKTAIMLLPAQNTYKGAPTKAAAYGALARTYLSMRQYEQAGLYADSCIQSYGPNQLLDFNNPADVVPTAFSPFALFHKEVIFHCIGQSTQIIDQGMAIADSALIDSYSAGDLRKSAYYTTSDDWTYTFKGFYDPNSYGIFGGLALDEIYLIRAECRARAGQVPASMDDLNQLLQTRWKTGTYKPYTISDQTETIRVILAERRKELVFRDLRWSDLRRLQFEPDFAITPVRVLNGQTYQLLPGSPRYSALIPQQVIELSGIAQNP